MKKYFPLLLLLILPFLLKAQITEKNRNQFPIFPNCENRQSKNFENCFYAEVQNLVYNNFKVPESLQQNNYRGSVIVLFEVNEKGVFKVQYVDAVDAALVEESKRVFESFPAIKPPTYNRLPVYSKYTITISIPLQSAAELTAEQEAERTDSFPAKERNKELTEYSQVGQAKFENSQFESHLNIPFSHSYYAQFDSSMNQVGGNSHTASKPYTYAEVSKYYNLKDVNKQLQKKATGWWLRKIWNENLVAIQGDGYWFTMNPIFDLQMGKSKPSVSKSTFVNTRGIQLQGGLGKQLNFTTTLYESQGRFADYFNRYAESIKPSGGNPAIIPGIGIAKEFKADAYDFPLAEANLTYTPSKFVNLQMGYGRNFIGDGYRSLLESDGASPYPYVKVNTNFWKIKYTNTYMWLKDVRPEVTIDKTYATKYMANHYLSWNVSKKVNLGFFESVVWTNTNNRGFDMSFVNPIVFYRSVEFASSSRSGNALLGLTAKYKWNNHINFYGQFLLDEFSLGEVKKQENSWKNKYGFQLGAKYFNALNIDNLLLQLEYNHVRPYVYSHSNPLTNYGHSNQSMGHQWGGNFKEFVAIARYYKGRYFADAKFTYGTRGLDFDTLEDGFNYGGNIYKSYDEKRLYDSGVEVGQGNKTTIVIADFQAGYLVNPASNLKLFGSFIYRNFDPTKETLATFKETTSWFSLGIRADLFNWYFDY